MSRCRAAVDDGQDERDARKNGGNAQGGMMKGHAMMKSDEMKSMGGMMGNMSGMMGDMRPMMAAGKMTPEEMENMSKMMGDMSGMMKQMSDRMRQGTKKAN